MKTGEQVSTGQAVVRTTPCGDEKFITILPGPKQPDLTEAIPPLLDQINKQGLRVVAQQNFVGLQFDLQTHAERIERMGQANWPVTYVQAEAPARPVVQAVQLHCIPDRQVETIQGPGGQTIGCIWQDRDNRYCKLGGRLIDPAGMDRRQQSDAKFLAAESALAQAGMDFNDVVRTWFFNDRILDWYGDFNKSRTQYFESRDVFEGIVPASTGIGAFNACNDALSLQLIAAKGLEGRKNYQAVDSPLQKSAMDYGSSFSRAAELAGTGFRRLYVSGTASIDRGGKTLHLEDLEKQINLTLDIVAAIVESRRMTWDHTSRGIAYVAKQEDVDQTQRIMQQRGLSDLPIVVLVATVCRHDLLYELELDTVISD